MAQNHPLSTPFGATGDGDSLEDALVARVALCFDDVADVQALDLTGKATTKIILGNDVYDYDPTRSGSEHNGTTILGTADGKAFVNDGTRVKGWSGYDVDDQDLTSPPASPASGDSYLVPSAPSGDWAAFGNHIAVYRNEDWIYIAPRRGMLCFVADEAGFVHYDGTAWQAGFGDYSVSAGALKADRMEQAYGWRVEAEQAAPPGSVPGAGVLYIVAASATGAWSGEDGNIARSTGSAWEFVTAAEGMTAFNKALGFNVSYKSGSWQVDRPSGKLLFAGRRVAASTAPTIGTTYVEYLDFGTHAVAAANNIIRVRGSFAGFVASGATRTLMVGLFFDSESSPRQTATCSKASSGSFLNGAFELEYVVPDTSDRGVFIKFSADAASAVGGSLSVYGYLEEVSG